MVGLLFVLLAAVVLLLTVENALNRIWQVKKDRPLLKRMGCTWLMLAVGPLLLGASLWATSYLLGRLGGADRHAAAPGGLRAEPGPVLLGTAALAFLFYFVPNTRVRRRDALVGGLLGSIVLELGKRGFAAYLLTVPTYKTLYGGFAVVPVFLLWVYFSWLVTLAAALVAANLARQGARAQRAA